MLEANTSLRASVRVMFWTSGVASYLGADALTRVKVDPYSRTFDVLLLHGTEQTNQLEVTTSRTVHSLQPPVLTPAPFLTLHKRHNQEVG